MGKSGKKNKKQTADVKEAASKDPNNSSKKNVRNKPNNKTNWQNVMLAKIGVLGTAFLISVVALIFSTSSEQQPVFASAKEGHEKLVAEIPCSKDYVSEPFKGCIPSQCKRVVLDHMVTTDEAKSLLLLAKKGLAFGGSDGGASILDLHSGALSKGNSFVDIFKMLGSKFSEVFTKEDFQIYKRVKEKVFQAIINEFNIPHTDLYLTKPTFFSRMTPKPAKTIHDEYWHLHIDKKTYGTFHYTSLLYLTTYGKDFTGGRFTFVDKDKNSTVEPKLGRVSFFTSGSENPHFVEKVSSGERYAITISFTCDPTKAIKIQ
ncbi:2-oxoglutarate and iron-dependent oxygenase domain-containing protein 3 isoform X1 [Octopus sinensis]|uniref:2-oxoglutarate and iron-dependent oxygenase domain-containing protein 3 isoform X1 n=2 Tax=Octopus sinensis TaxID=2607531 RepID=A0A6P7SMV5_9MOLL|nr:2-oxoglutarate and iron-dependent oxygenase domain-containing protein 3 isoform X1 [Octopus sinensis]